MERVRRHWRLSATDVKNALACAHLAAQEQRTALGRAERPERREPMLDLSIKYGFEYEKQFLHQLHQMGLRIGVVEPDRTDDRSLFTDAADTLKLIDSGHFDVIYQPTFAGETASGRVEVAGHGDFAFYDHEDKLWKIADTKLARHVKVGVPLQLAFYNEALRDINGGRTPDEMYVILGDGTIEALRTADYSAYARAAIERTESIVLGDPGDHYPEKNDHCTVCAWFDECSGTWVAADDLGLVRRIIPQHRRKLIAQGVDTVTKLAAHDTAVRIAGVGQSSVERLVQQAKLQLHERETGEKKWEFVDPPEVDRGLYRVREPQVGDLYFDLETHPFVGEHGTLYLAVVAELRPEGKTETTVFVTHPDSGASERAWDFGPDVTVIRSERPGDELWLFDALMEHFRRRIARNPETAIHHWGHFDPAELVRQAGKHSELADRREDDLDVWIHDRRFVDMYSIFDQGIRFSGRSYGLKKVEHLFDDVNREVEVEDGAASVMRYDQYLDAVEAEDHARADELMRSLVEYCQADVVSLPKGHRWLWSRRCDLVAKLERENRRPRAPKREKPAYLQHSEIAKAEFQLRRRLNRNRPLDLDRATDDELARVRTRELLYWHRREARPEYADFRRRLEMDDSEFFDDAASIGELEYLGIVDTIKQSHVHRYAFDAAQEYRFKVGDEAIDPVTAKSIGTVVGIGLNPDAPDGKAGWIDLSRSRHIRKEHPRAIIPEGPINTVELRQALVELGEHVLEHGAGGGTARGRYSWALDLLMQRAPHFQDGERSASLVEPGERPVDAAVRLSAELDRGVLVVQGAPGAGKSFTGAAIVRDAVRRGQRVFVLGPSHYSITNLIDEIDAQATLAREDFAILQRTRKGKARSERDRVAVFEDRRSALDHLDDRNDDGSWRYPVVAATLHGLGAHLASTGEHFDLLVADEAGQQSLANVVSAGGLARSAVLLGDQQQLPQVTRASHPLGMGASSLEHYLGGHDTVPEGRGVLLGVTRRCHPEIARFVSEQFYEGRLTADAGAARQSISGTDLLAGVGLAYVPVLHRGNRMRSREEAATVADLVWNALGRTWTDRDGVERPMTPADIMVITPFNAQLGTLREALREVSPEVEVGTVDSFQGREAALVIYSTATSEPDLAPRGVDFIFDLGRFNVAISRARAKFVMVGNPDLASAQCRRPEQMRMVNALSRFIEVTQSGWETRPAVVFDRDALHRRRLGELMRIARGARGETQAEIAQRIKRSPALVSKIERGGSVSEETLRKMTRALDWRIEPVRSVLDGTDPVSGLYRALAHGLEQLDGLSGR